ncbi:MAG TPA: AAA family ATPase, partial [Steroidobacteraceae bacterium]|nr:AAA family ATPase [Steroidobacteraceae bacterium]
ARRHRKLEGQPLPLALYRRNDIDVRDVKKRAAMIGRLVNLNNIFLDRYGARLGCVILDTISASCPMKDENSNAEIADISRALREFNEILDVVIVGVHHFGKNADSGLRGGSGWRANCDHSRIFLGDKEGPEAPVRNRRMVLEKNRLGVEGDVFGFDLGVMSFGKDIYGDEATECHVMSAIYKKQTVTSEIENSFHKAFVKAAMDYQHPFGKERPNLVAVPLLSVRDAFVTAWVTGEESLTKDESSAKRVAWHRGLKKAREGSFLFEKIEVEEWIWPHA